MAAAQQLPKRPAKGQRVFVVGVGMTKFCRPARQYDPLDPDYPDFGKVAVTRALEDACIEYKDVEAAAVGSVFGGAKGQRCLYELGMTGIPVHNVANACASGSNALYLARTFIAGGLCDVTLALGVEKMKPGPLDSGPKAPGASGVDHHLEAMGTKFPWDPKVPQNPQMFGNAGLEHMELYNSTPAQFAAVGEKNHRHSAGNPYSQYRDVYTQEQVEKSRVIYHARSVDPAKGKEFPVTLLQCSPPSDGAACAILMSEAAVKRYGLEGQAVEIVAQTMHTDYPSAFEGGKPRTCINMVGFDMAKAAAEEAYKISGFTPKDVQVIELHDCFSANEIITYEALGLCGEGEGGKLVESGQTTYGGRWVVNPSGGLISKGHPLSATGLAQCAELNWQLRQEAGVRQVSGAKVALQHNLGMLGTVIVTIYKRPEEWLKIAPKRKQSGGMGFPRLQSRL